jgi:ribosome biogenesis GTPase A
VPRSAAALAADLAALAELAGAADRAEIDELCRRLGAGILRVLVVGEAKRGKSTLLNALLGRPVLPTGVLPLTTIATTLAYGAAEAVAVRYADGRVT